MLRNDYYDKIKGFAMILVVLGHAVQSVYTVDFDSVEVFRIIYSFHMPLFMFISGIISYNEKLTYDYVWLKKRFVSLVIPFIVWFFVPFIVKQKQWDDLQENTINLLRSPDYGLWFLWVLFLNCCLLFISYKVLYAFTSNFFKKIFLIFVVIILFVNLIKHFFPYLGLELLSWHCVFYLLGHMVGKNKEILKKYKWVIGFFSLAIWILLIPFWRRTEVASIFVLLPTRFRGFQYLLNRLFNYLVGISGTSAAFMVVYLIKHTKVSFIFEKIGRRTIEIYILQIYFFNIFTLLNKPLMVFINFLLGLICPYIISELYKNGSARKILFGKG